MSEDRPHPITRLSADVKATLSTWALFPLLPIVHFVVDRQDCKKLWSEDLSRSLAVIIAVVGSASTAVWMSLIVSFSNENGRYVTLEEHDAKINAAVVDETCEFPAEKTQVICGVEDISPTEYKGWNLPFSSGDIDGERISVIATKNITGGFNVEGQPRQKICVSFGYVSGMDDGESFDFKNVKTVSTECNVVELGK